MTLEGIIETWYRPYIDIILVTVQFQQEGGLLLRHYQHALVNSDAIKSWKYQYLSCRRGDGKFIYGKRKTTLTRNNLHHKLKKLVEKKIIEKTTGKDPRYKINQATLQEIEKLMKEVADSTEKKEYIEQMKALPVEELRQLTSYVDPSV